MRIYIFDPGKTTGMAHWDTSKNDKPRTFGEYKKDELFDFLDSIQSDPLVDYFVYENYRIRINPKQKGFHHSFEEVEPCRIIGAIELRAHQLQVPVVKQESSVLKVGCAYAGIPYDPKKHVKDHLSAIAHGYYFLVKRKIIYPNDKNRT